MATDMDEKAPVLLLHEAVLLLPHCAVVVALLVVVVVSGGLHGQCYHTIITLITILTAPVCGCRSGHRIGRSGGRGGEARAGGRDLAAGPAQSRCGEAARR